MEAQKYIDARQLLVDDIRRFIARSTENLQKTGINSEDRFRMTNY